MKPDYYPAWSTKGRALEIGFERYEEALKCYEKVIELNPKKQSHVAWAWYEKCGSLYELSRYKESIEAANKALELDLNSSTFVSDAVYTQACCYALLKEDNLALTYLKKAVELDKSYKDWVKQDTDWDALRSDKRFQLIVTTEEAK